MTTTQIQLEHILSSFQLSEFYIEKMLYAIDRYIKYSAKFSQVKKKDRKKVSLRKKEIEGWIEYYRRQAVMYNQFHPVLKLPYGSTYLNQMSHMHMNINWLRQLQNQAANVN